MSKLIPQSSHRPALNSISCLLGTRVSDTVQSANRCALRLPAWVQRALRRRGAECPAGSGGGGVHGASASEAESDLGPKTRLLLSTEALPFRPRQSCTLSVSCEWLA